MNEATLNYVRQHADDDVRQLALRGSKDPDVDLMQALQQIQGRQTAKRKLPSWAAVEGVLYPPRLSMEQCSSEATACYKTGIIYNLHIYDLRFDSTVGGAAQIVNRKNCQIVNGQSVNCQSVNGQSVNRKSVNHKSVNRKLIDLTGGFGVDLAFMSQAFDETVYVERSEELCRLAAHNMPLVTTTPVTVVCADGIEYMKAMGRCTMLFLDPARRDGKGARTYALADCTPNVVPVIGDLLGKADSVMLKLSPMLDWRKAVNDVGAQHVSQVHIVAVDNECKELLLLLQQEAPPMQLFCVDIDSATLPTQKAEASAASIFTVVPAMPVASVGAGPVPARPPKVPVAPSRFLYEPNAAIMKAGCFEALTQQFSVSPLAHDSHLFVSDNGVEDFPGRRFVIDAVTSMNKRELKATLGHLRQANITVRHFPLSAEELRKRLRLADGGNDYIFATTLSDGSHILLLCHKDIP